MGGPNFTGPAIFGGMGQGVQQGMDLGLKYKHMMAMEEIAKNNAQYKGVYQATKNFIDRGGMHGPIQDESADAGAADQGGGGSAPQSGSPSVSDLWDSVTESE